MPVGDTPVPLRTRIYVDGYNFYYGCLKGTPYKWLDLLSLFERWILPSAHFKRGVVAASSHLLPLAIKYFTAAILEKAAKADDSVSSQSRYHSALRKHIGDRLQMIEGYYSITESRAKVVDPQHPSRWPRKCQEALVWKLEEKQSDVNLALQLYHDALTGEIDHAVIVTNDTDIAPALKMIRQNCNVTLGLVVPTRAHQRIPNTELAELAHWVRTHITVDELSQSQLPRVIPGRKPTVKPMSWYAQPELLAVAVDLAVSVLGSQSAAFKWMEKPNSNLGGAAPIELLEREEGAALVMAYMQQYIEQHKTGSGDFP